jgi:hypothetical protein
MTERAVADSHAESVFMRCLAVKRAQGIEVVATTGRGYAPSVFAGMPEAKGVSKKRLAEAMERLLSAQRLKQDVVGGPPSRPKHGLVDLV